VCSNPSPAATRAAALGIRDKLTTGGNAAAAAAAATEVVSTFKSGVAVVGALVVGALALVVVIVAVGPLVVVAGALRLKVSDDDSDE